MKQEQTPIVVVYTTSFLPLVGGAEIAIAEITKRTPSLRFLILTSRTSRRYPRVEIHANVTIKRLGFGNTFDKWLLPILAFFEGRRVLWAYPQALFWGMMISQGTIGAYFLKKIYPRVPLLVTVQEGDSEEYLRMGRAGLIRFFWKRVLGVADHVTVISAYLGGLVRHAGFHGEISIVPNGVDEHYVSEAFEQAPVGEYKTGLGIKASETVLISISRLAQKNGLRDLIEAVSFLAKRDLKVKLLLAGDGEEKDRLRTLARNLGISDRVVFLGTVPHEDLLRYYRMSDIFVRPSRSEGLGNSFLEAMGAGVPVIATPVGGILDFLEDGKTGIFVESANPVSVARGVERILSDDALRSDIIHNARELVIQKYLWVDIAKRMEEIFGSLASKKI